jgi:hypothetical protein
MLSSSRSHRLARPIHARARVRDAPLRAGETIEYAPGDRRDGTAFTLRARSRSMRRGSTRTRAAINNAGAIKITAIQDPELVVVGAL